MKQKVKKKKSARIEKHHIFSATEKVIGSLLPVNSSGIIQQWQLSLFIQIWKIAKLVAE